MHTALVLFVSLAVIEMVLFGVVWAFKQDEAWGALIFKIIKLSVVFGIITMYPVILRVVIDGFTHVAWRIGDVPVSKYFLNPTLLWGFSLKYCLALFKIGISYGTFNIAVSLLYIILGLGTLLVFSLIAAQVTLVVVGFYVVSILALLLIPFGALSLSQRLFYRALHGVFSMGARVFAMVCLMGLAIQVWFKFDSVHLTATTNLSLPLIMFMFSLTMAWLFIFVPQYAAQMVGRFGGNIFDGFSQSSVVTAVSPGSPAMSAPQVSVQNAVAQAVSSGPASMAAQPATAAASGSTTMVTSSGNSQVMVAPKAAATGSQDRSLKKGSSVSQLSPEQLSRLRSQFKSNDHETR
jgi:type IV secretory pathway TrbL component